VTIPKTDYPWQIPYFKTLYETDFSVLPIRVKEALEAVDQRLKSPVEPGSAEELALKRAKTGLLAMQTGTPSPNPAYDSK
jgi:hypothetical protein